VLTVKCNARMHSSKTKVAGHPRVVISDTLYLHKPHAVGKGSFSRVSYFYTIKFFPFISALILLKKQQLFKDFLMVHKITC